METYNLYIVLLRTNTILSNLIKAIKKDEFTHAAISLDKNLDQMYGFGRISTYNPFIGGFKKEDLNKGLYRIQKKLPGAIIELGVTEEQYNRVKEMIEHFMFNSGKYRYNYEGLLNSLLNRADFSDYKFVCSEFVYYTLLENGIVDFNIPRNLIRPQDFIRLNGKMIYNGDLKNINHNDDSISDSVMIGKLKSILEQS